MKTREEMQESISKLYETLKGARQTVDDLENELSNLKYKDNLLKMVETLDATLPGKYEEFQILAGCRYNDSDNKPWTNIIVGKTLREENGYVEGHRANPCNTQCRYYDNKITIKYPDSVEFDKEFKELLKKYITKQI